jgi:uncharacterized protein (TIGR03382 family)
MNRALLVFAVLLFGCDTPITATSVSGSALGVSFSSPTAVSVTDKDLLGGTRQTIFLGDNLRCTDLRRAPFDFGPSAAFTPDGGRSPLLIVGGATFLDTGRGSERVSGSTTAFHIQSTRSDGALTGRFAASFVTDLDGGALPDGGTFSGDFFTAVPCSSASAGCDVAPLGTFTVLAFAWLVRRRQRS